MKTRIIDFIDFDKVNTLLEGFNQSTGFVTAILDLEGNILSKSGWRQICTDFHRENAETSRRCTISDTVLAGEMKKGEKYHFYKCLNGLVDVAVPIIIKGEHIANLFSGQFFFEKPNDIFFQKQAEIFGFNKERYLKALADVPIISEEKVKIIMQFLLNMTQLISDMTFQRMELLELNKTLQENEDTYKMLFESINDAVFISELSEKGELGNFIKVNDIACKRLGYTQAELLSKSVVEISSEKVKQDINSKLQNLVEIKNAIIESEHVTKDGRIIPVEISTNVTNFRGKTIFHSIARDITERNRIATTLRQSEEKFKKAFLTNPDAITITRLSDGVYVSANMGFTQIFGYPEAEILGKTSREINIWHNINERSIFVQKLQESGSIENFETSFNTKDGRVITCLVFSAIIELEGVPNALTVTRDITERKHAELLLQEKTDEIEAQNEEYQQINEELNQTNAELYLAKERAEESEKQTKTMFSALNAGIVIIDILGNIIEWNSTFINYFGYSPEEFKALNTKDITFPDDIPTTFNYVSQIVSNQIDSFRFEKRFLRKDKSVFWVDLCGSALKKDGEVYALLGVVYDITERKNIEIQLNNQLHELNIAKKHAEESDRLKTAFLQNMSHEIRTPMNAIMGFAELLKENLNNSTKLINFSQIINQRCADLLQIINEILDVAKIESGQIPVNIEECKINTLFSELDLFFTEFQKKQGKEHIWFHTQTHDDISASVILTDKVKLKQILINLIGNAFKFTEKGEIRAGYKFNSNNHLLFYVSDTGIGIPSDKQNFIFERFAQLEQTPGHLYGGTGLGLSIVKGLIDLLGGKIWLESELGKGTTFYFSLPYEIVDYLSSEQSSIEESEKYCFSNKTILIVEDDIYNAEYIKEVLDGTGFKVFHATYGNEAIQISKSQKLDIVLMDIRLPDMTGYTATRMIKKIRPELKIIAQTAFAAPNDKEKAIEAGCNDYVSKPIKPDLLLSVINRQLLK